MSVTHHTGHVLDIVRALPDASVDLVATSPPFLALRNYNGLPDQWGSEPTPAAFLAHLIELTTELRRVLTPHGSIAIELGDTYSSSGGTTDNCEVWQGGNDMAPRPDRGGGPGWPGAKSLCGTPTLFAWSLAYGRNLLDPAQTVDPWLVRNVIVWARNNPPVGALGDKVRPAVSYITVATPSPRRWFDLDAVRTEALTGDRVMRQTTATFRSGNVDRAAHQDRTQANNPAGAPPLDHWHDQPDGDLLWLINTQGSNLSHYAMWPPALAERLILSMCPAQVCRTCGEPRRRLTSDRERFTSVQPDIAAHIRACRERAGLTSDDLNRHFGYREIAKNWERTDRHGAAIPNPDDWIKLKELIGVGDDFDAVVLGDRRWHQDHAEYIQDGERVEPRARVAGDYMGSGSHGKKDGSTTRITTTLGWSDCGHDDYRPGAVLDPFAGTGTTLAAADINGRDAIGIDLDPANAELHATRWAQCWRALRPDAGPSPITNHGEQLGLGLI